MNPIDFFNKIHADKREEEDIKKIREELINFYQLNVLDCYEREEDFDIIGFKKDFKEFMKDNFSDMEDNYCMDSAVDCFLEEIQNDMREE